LLTLTEGKNREVRKLFEAAGRSVVRLVRVQIGPLRIGKMRPGQFRDLTPREVSLLAASGTGGGRQRRDDLGAGEEE
jgi:23S rRNA pseudouridine2605 synthase